MKAILQVMCVVVGVVAFAGCDRTVTIEVSPTGAVRSPADAVMTARQLRSEGRVKPGEPIRIRMASGQYALEKPLRLEPEDSHLRFVCEDGFAEITSARDLGHFTADAQGLWHLKVSGGLAFDQLFVNGRRATVARSPNREYYFMRETVFEWTDRRGVLHNAERTAFLADNRADVATLAADPYEIITNARVHVFWAWDSDYLRIADVDAKRGVVSLAAPAKLDFFRWPKFQTRYVLENYRGALDEAGEWYYDAKAGEILYLPRPGEDVATARAEVPRLAHVMEIVGTSEKRVTDVTFHGLAFGLTGYRFPKRLNGRQAAFSAPCAVDVRFADRIGFASCRFAGCAGYALDFAHAVRQSSVTESVFTDLGAGGMRIGNDPTISIKTPNDEICEFIKIDDNAFLAGGKVFTDGVGILLANARDCSLTCNEIRDFYYSGINAGWTWGYGETVVARNLIAWNHIRDIGQGVQSDMAGIYTLGRSPETRVCCNVIHDVYGWDYTGHGCEGLYTDEGSVGIAFVSNVVYRTKGASYNNHYGNDMVLENNIFYDAHDPDGTTKVVNLGGYCGRHGKEPEGHPAFTARGNLFVGGKGSMMTSSSGKRRGDKVELSDMFRFAKNLYWSADGIAATNRYANGTKTFDQWRAEGFDKGSVFADPLFVDAEHDDFRLRKDSPAFATGFKEWDYRKAGARTAALRRLAEAHPMEAFRKPKAPKPYLGPARFETSFEPCKKGARPGGFQLEGEVILVTDETARTGKKSVKIVDVDKKQARSYLPHLPATMYAGKGDSFEVAISIKFDEKCNTDIQLRDVPSGNPISHVGLSKGQMIQSRGAKDALKDVKPGVWYDLTWTFHFKPDSTVYDFTVVSEKGERIVMKDLPTNLSGPRRPTWFGIMSYGHQNGVLYIDDFRFGPK